MDGIYVLGTAVSTLVLASSVVALLKSEWLA